MIQGVYRKKPVEVHAIEFTGDNLKEIREWAISHGTEPDDTEWLFFKPYYYRNPDVTGVIGVKTRGHTAISATKGDMIIRGVDGDFYPCKPDIFSQTYDKVSE